MRSGLISFAMVICLLWPTVTPVLADGFQPTRYGAALLAGNAYDPEKIGLLIVQGQALIDYDRVAWHAAPDALWLKLEGNLGITTDGRERGLAAVNALALYYLEPFRSVRWKPFVEAGIGLIYTDFKVDGQGLRFNFNPQAGCGAEYELKNGSALTAALRFHHISNGNTHEDNRGVNSAFLMIGYLF